MRRIAIVGPLGSGKSTMARTLAERLAVERIDLDELFHRPGWEATPTPEFRSVVAEALADADRVAGGWAVAGNYPMVADLTQGRADTILWLDLSRVTSVRRVVARSTRRILRRETLWNGNRETLRGVVSPRTSVVVEAWRKHPVIRSKYEALAETPMWSRATVVRLRSQTEIDDWLAAREANGPS